MISKIQNSVVTPASIEQPDVKNVDASKNEISIETIESSKANSTGSQDSASLIMERKLQGDLQAAQLRRQLNQSGKQNNVILPYLEQDAIVTNNQDPDKMIKVPNGAFSPQAPGTDGVHERRRSNRRKDDDSEVTFGWDVKQNAKD